MKKFMIYLSILMISNIYAQCDDYGQSQCNNDNSCEWIKDLSIRTNIKTLVKNQECDLLIIGAGYTGLSAARKLNELHSNKKIIIVVSYRGGVTSLHT